MSVVVAPEPSALSSEGLEREIAELGAHIQAATCRWLLLVAEFDRRDGWAPWGAKSCADWLSWHCGVAPGTARDQLRVARRLAELPLTREACKRRLRPPPRVARLGRRRVAAAAGAAPRRGRGAADACAQGRAGRALGDRGGRKRSAETSPGAEPRAARPTTVDALVAMAEASLAAPGGSRSGGERYQVVVHADAAVLSGEGDGQCEVEDGPALPAETARRLACDASIVPITERDGRPLSVGRKTRELVPATRGRGTAQP